MRTEIGRLVDRTGKNAEYYAALDRQHFGASPSASNFLDYASVEEALEACWYDRGGFSGNDREKLLALGAEEKALLGEDVCRYLVFSARGRLGLADVVDLGRYVLIELVREKPGIPLSLVVAKEQSNAVRIARPRVEFGTVIISSDGELWTTHPGLPNTPRTEPIFEMAGFVEGDVFSVADLVDSESEGGIVLRAAFASRGVEFPEIKRVKVPA
jgi:hypothetical protein